VEFTKFDFSHKVFSVPGTFICGKGHEREPVLNMQVGGLTVTLPIIGVCREFGIEHGSPDSQLLRLATQALDHVKFIAPGDQIPNEILDGSASWHLDDRHLEYSNNRLMLALADWTDGGWDRPKDPREMAAHLAQEDTRKRVQAGFTKAAKVLGLKTREEVVPLIEQLARERGYVVALREYFHWILALPKSLKQTQAAVRQDRNSLETAIRVEQIASTTVDTYRKKFREFDNQMDDIPSILNSLPSAIDLIRTTRDDLHRETLFWREVEEAWKKPDFENLKNLRKNVADLYTFLAQNFMQH